jgi:hypothetical protein
MKHRKQDSARPVPADSPLISDSTATLIIAVATALISEPMLGWFVVAALLLGISIALILRSWHKRHPDT